MRVLPHIERPIDSLLSPVVADSLGNRQDMCFGECAAQWRTTVPAGTEDNEPVRVIGIRAALVISRLQATQNRRVFPSEPACLPEAKSPRTYRLLAHVFLDYWAWFYLPDIRCVAANVQSLGYLPELPDHCVNSFDGVMIVVPEPDHRVG